MGSIGSTEILLILVIALLVFGPTRLPEMGRSLGRAVREFKRATSDLQETLEREVDDVKRTGGGGPDAPPGALPPPSAPPAPPPPPKDDPYGPGGNPG